ncbi:hypothetical protein D1627_11230 [Pontibacter oryzae]|uniref:Uncharacterized protein n=1 Tax=Pontibacter oryzae TaxID=2304593 RepID=A0A399S4Z1_9BACT|nr:hypothetical protein D1627_11230 [Pontibacter oryzae]
MIKLSKDNLQIWKSLFPSLLIVVHVLLSISILISAPAFIVIVYLLFVIFHFFIVRYLRYFKIKEIYLLEDNKQLIIRNLDTLTKSTVEFHDILKVKMSFGLIELEVQSNEKIYTIPHSKWEFNYLKTLVD